jgi:DNA-binding LytR/AlgR family response regulator
VPFAFTTGYNDLIFLPPRLRDYPHLTKPYNPSDVKNLVAKLRQQVTEQMAIASNESNQVA